MIMHRGTHESCLSQTKTETQLALQHLAVRHLGRGKLTLRERSGISEEHDCFLRGSGNTIRLQAKVFIVRTEGASVPRPAPFPAWQSHPSLPPPRTPAPPAPASSSRSPPPSPPPPSLP